MNDDIIIEEVIRLVNEGVCVTMPVSGYSMLPFIIGGRDSVILQRPRAPQLDDVVLAHVDDGRFVIHRIIRISDDGVTLMGDGNLAGTEHCQTTEIKALVTHVVDNRGHKHELYRPWRRKAVRCWQWLLPVRRYLLAIYKIFKS